MNMYEEGLQLLTEKFGNYKDNLISLATVATDMSEEGKPIPCVRTVDAYYEDGTFYVSTYAQSAKMLQIAQNSTVSIATSPEMFTAFGIGENLGWVLSPENATLRDKIRKAFSEWYDMANNEQDKNCIYLAIHLTKGVLNINHWKKLYHMDFVNKSCE